jgi:hypothetical protein
MEERSDVEVGEYYDDFGKLTRREVPRDRSALAVGSIR